jgi:hypothetical protein
MLYPQKKKRYSTRIAASIDRPEKEKKMGDGCKQKTTGRGRAGEHAAFSLKQSCS